MDIVALDLSGTKRVEPHRVGDDRGWFSESFRAEIFTRDCGNWKFVQENESLSIRAGTIRGLHFQAPPHSQGKLVRCTAGALFDVAVDIRSGSPTFGRWIAEELTPDNGKQLWIPPGFAHGFCSLKPDTVISYKVTDYYHSGSDKGLAWNDPAVAIDWPDIADPETLSIKDRKQPRLDDLSACFAWSEQPCA